MLVSGIDRVLRFVDAHLGKKAAAGGFYRNADTFLSHDVGDQVFFKNLIDIGIDSDEFVDARAHAHLIFGEYQHQLGVDLRFSIALHGAREGALALIDE